MKTLYNICLIFFYLNLICGCKKMVEIDAPVNSLTSRSVFNEDVTAASIMTGHYALLSNNANSFSNLTSVARFTGLSSDELILWSGVSDIFQPAYFKNSLFSSAAGMAGGDFWPYDFIYSCNSVLEGINSSTGLSDRVKQQLIGEAKFMRAYYYFHLTNLYGEVPMPLSTDINVNRLLPKSSSEKIYEAIIQDLLEAQKLLSDRFLDGTLLPYKTITATERVRPTKWAATALLARAYLYVKNWTSAEQESSKVLNESSFGLESLNRVFLKSSIEAIWQLQNVISDQNTGDGAFFRIESWGLNDFNSVYLSSNLLNTFEVGDQRNLNGNWINSIAIFGTTYYYPYKYKLGLGSKPGGEYQIMLRLGEQYLIRAEARAQQNNLSGAIADLDKIRSRAGLPLIANTNPGISQTALLDKIMHERQVELFTEGGHRWFDLKRTGKIDAVMPAVCTAKGGTWQTTDQLYPIPYNDISRNPNLTQNAGY